MSTPPRMSGVRTCTLIHGYVMPPHVSAMSASVVPATIIALPLRRAVESAVNFDCEGQIARGKHSHPVHAGELRPERPFRRADPEEDSNQDERDASKGQIDVCKWRMS